MSGFKSIKVILVSLVIVCISMFLVISGLSNCPQLFYMQPILIKETITVFRKKSHSFHQKKQASLLSLKKSNINQHLAVKVTFRNIGRIPQKRSRLQR